MLAAALLLVGCWVYCLLVVLAAWHYRRQRPLPLKTPVPVSILKPLAGLDEGLEQNLRSFFEQDYGEFEILFAVRAPLDPAVEVVERLRMEYPDIPTRLIVTGDPPYPNAKVFSLDQMLDASRHDLVVMSDSDVRVGRNFLRTLAAEFQDPAVGVATCPYRAAPGASFWSRLEALGLNTEFLAGVLVARLIEGIKFALGPTIAARRAVLEKIGGFGRLKEYLAEDFVLGRLAAESGWRVVLSSYVIEHRIGSQRFGANLRHRLRWNRSTRRSRPAGYVGQFFTNPLPLALLVWALWPHKWPWVAATVAFRAIAAFAIAGWVLRDPLTARRWWLLPLQDVASFLAWVSGFFGNTILWRGRQYYLLPDGRFQLMRFVPVALIFAVAGVAAAQEGHWEGSVQLPDKEMTIEIDLQKTGKGWVGTMNVPQQNARGLPLGDIVVDGKAVRFRLKAGSGDPQFEGTHDGTTMSGTFTQGGVTFTLKATRTGDPKFDPPAKSTPITRELEGTWEGALEASGQTLRLVLKLANGPEGATGTLISVDQGNSLIPITAITQEGAKLSLEVKAVSGSFRGEVKGNEIIGDWTQLENRLPLTFKRAAAEKK